MRTYIFTLFMLLFATIGSAQVISTKYYSNEWSSKEVSQEKAKFVETVSKDKSGAVTTELRNVKKNTIVRSETYRNEEPVGIWIYEGENGGETYDLDYSFQLDYDDYTCNDSIPGIKDYFQSNDTLHYRAPSFERGMHIYQFLANTIVYPPFAKENDISGKVILKFTVTETGTVENVVILKGHHIVLDKEAARVVRMMKFSHPPLLNGIRKKLCFTLPVTFKLN